MMSAKQPQRAPALSFGGASPGFTLAETVVALAILSMIAVTFITGLITTGKAAAITDERTTAESVARSQMEWAQNAEYVAGATSYPSAPLPAGETGYSATINASPLHNPDDGIQKVTIQVARAGQQVFMLEGYKVNR